MAGDWLKMEKATARKPEVILIAVALSIHPDEAFGICFRFWSWCDDQVSDGKIRGFTEALIDATIDRKGFAAALVSVGWLEVKNGMISITNFDRHLSHSAKTRAESAIRKKKERSKPVTKMSQKIVTSVTELSQESVTTVTGNQDKNVTIEKRREENMNTESVTRTHEADDLTFLTPPSKPFNRFWDALPDGMKSGQVSCVKAFPDAIYAIMAGHGIEEAYAIEHLVNRTKQFAKSPKGRDVEFRWSPLTFLKDGHYDDSDESWAARPARANKSIPGGGQSLEQIRKQKSFNLLAAFAATDEGGFSGSDEPPDRIEANR